MNIIGQTKALHYLKQGLSSGRLTPSLLFTGADGVGKRTVAVELAKCFACSGTPPFANVDGLPRCGSCNNCRRIEENNHPDLMILNRVLQAQLLKEKPESQTAIKIEMIREVDHFLHLRPVESGRRVVIVDEAHKMTDESANAMLKVLEEPPNNAQIILLAANEKSLPSTVLSRCGIVRFSPIPAKNIAVWLEQNAEDLTPELAYDLAMKSGGSFSKALQLAEEESSDGALSDYSPDEFFQHLSETGWRKEARQNAERALGKLIAAAQKKMAAGDFSQRHRLEQLLFARKQIDRNASPKLVLESLYITSRK